MSDYIRREDATNAVYKAYEIILDSGNFSEIQACEQVNRVLRSVPSADVVEVVRCKDCKHYDGVHYVRGIAPCKFWGSMVSSDDYCSRGERKDNSGEATEMASQNNILLDALAKGFGLDMKGESDERAL